MPPPRRPWADPDDNRGMPVWIPIVQLVLLCLVVALLVWLALRRGEDAHRYRALTILVSRRDSTLEPY